MAETEQQTLVIHIDGWLGRVVAMTGAITEVAKKRPVKVITSRPLVFRWNHYIKSVHWLDDRRLFEDVIKGNDYIELEPYTVQNTKRCETIYKEINLSYSNHSEAQCD